MDTPIARPAPPRRWIPFLVPILLGLAACGQGPTTGPTVTSVTVDPTSLRLVVGASAALEATVHGGPADPAVTWTSDDATIAAVDDDGTVTAVAEGTTHVTATSDHDPAKSASAEVVVVPSGGPAPLDWTVQFGTVGLDMGAAVAVDSQGFVIVVGSTMGDLAGPSAGGYDAFVRKHAPDGAVQWTRQFGTPGWDEALAVTTDADDHILVAGATGGDLGGPNQGNSDAFVRRYSPDGDVAWTEQFGTAQFDRAVALTIDGDGDLVVAGQGVGVPSGEGSSATFGFVRKFTMIPDAGVTEQWTHVAPTLVEGLAVDGSGHVVAIGSVHEAELGFEAYVVKLTSAGDEAWSGLYGTGAVPEDAGGEREAVPSTRRPGERWQNLLGFEDVAHAVALDADGNVFLTGYMGGYETGTGHSNQKAYVLKLTPVGDEEWAVLFGDTYATYGISIAIDADGDVVVVGNTASYYSERSPRGTEMFTRKLTTDGMLLWDDTFGDSGWDTSTGVAIDAQGNVFVVGYTLGDLGGPNSGVRDVYLRKYGR